MFSGDSGAVGRGHGQVEANPKVNVNRPWGGSGEGSLPLGLLDYGLVDNLDVL